jgi:hypothetical protein
MPKKLKFNERESTKYVSIAEGAERCGVSYARFRKALQRLGILVRRHGWSIMVPTKSIKAVKKALTDGTIKRGRKKKAG